MVGGRGYFHVLAGSHSLGSGVVSVPWGFVASEGSVGGLFSSVGWLARGSLSLRSLETAGVSRSRLCLCGDGV